MISKALREYEAVTAETTFADGSTRTAIDVRRFGWIRPLAGDYAFNFAKIAPLYAGDPSTRQAWTETIARTRGMARPRAEVADLLAAQQERRGAPPAAREAARSSPTRDRRHPHRSAGRGVRRPALHAAQGHHRHPAGPHAPRASSRRTWCQCSGWMPRITTGKRSRAVRCSTPASSRARSRCRSPRAPASGRSPHSSWTAASSTASTSSPARSARPSSPTGSMASLRAAYRPGVGMADAFARWLETLLGPHGLVVFDSSDPAAKPLVADLFARELGAAGRTAALATGGGRCARGSRTPAAGRAAARQRRALPSRWRAPAHSPAGRCTSSSARRTFTVEPLAEQARTTPTPLQPERAAPPARAGHALSDDLLRRRPERARVPRPAARGLRAASASRCR